MKVRLIVCTSRLGIHSDDYTEKSRQLRHGKFGLLVGAFERKTFHSIFQSIYFDYTRSLFDIIVFFDRNPIFPSRPPTSDIWLPPSAIRHPPSAIRHPPSAISYSSSVIGRRPDILSFSRMLE
jgi:hypothetical protein